MASLDIVIVNWNAGAQLQECLASVESMETDSVFHLAKCLVVDNASTDGSANRLKLARLPVQLIANAENKGFGKACNQGAAAGQGDYILFLNPDIKLHADSLARAVGFLEEPRNASIGLLGIQLVDESCRPQPTTGRFPTPGAMLSQMVGLDRLWPARFPPFPMSNWSHGESRKVDVLQGAWLLIRRPLFVQLGGFDERFFMYYEDVDLAYRARRAGWAAYYFAEARAFHRGGGVTEKIKAGRLAYWMHSRVQYVAKHFGAPAAAGIIASSLSLELAARLLWNAATLSWPHLGETIRAYRKYLRTLPNAMHA